MPSSASQIFSNRSRIRSAGSLALVCFPALLLAVIGFFYLRHEIAIAEREVREEARSAAFRVSEALNRRWAEFLQEGKTSMRKIGPKIADGTRLSELTPSSQEARRQASEAYRRALALIAEGEWKAAEEILRPFCENDSTQLTESGLPLRPLAFYQLAKLTTPEQAEFFEGNLTMALATAIRKDPSPISETLLRRAQALAESRGLAGEFEFDGWWRQWRAVSRSREILSPHLNREFFGRDVWQRWLEHEGIRYHLVISPDAKFFPVSLPELETLAGEAVGSLLEGRSEGEHPLTFSISYHRQPIRPAPFDQELTRKEWFDQHGYDLVGLGAGNPLADIGGSGPFGIRVKLANREAFYEAIRNRMFWLGGFLALAVGCTGLGAWRTWRAIEKQRELNRQQGDFISSVSHELRAPVASIRLLGELLASGKVAQVNAEKRGEYARLIERESGRLSALVDNVLDLSRIGRGTKQYQFESTDIAALVRDSVERMEPLAAEQGVAISAELDSTAEDPEIDPVAIQQALTNLLDNAIKFSPRDGKIEVTLKSGESGFQIAVRDEGPGIPDAEQERIFERFFRIGSELRRETEGIGIGLSLVRHIMEAHGGRVKIESTTGEGSTFTLVFSKR